MARTFNGSTDGIDYAPLLDPANGNGITFAAWVKHDQATPGNERYYSQDDGFTAYCASGYLRASFQCSGDPVYRTQSSANMTNSGWQHVVVTHDGSLTGTNIELYVDGSTGGYGTALTGTGTISTPSATMRIGNRQTADDRAFDGAMAEMATWHRELTADEISALASGVSPLMFPDAMVEYMPLINEPVRYHGSTGTLDGTTVSDHPPTIYPSRQPIIPVGKAGITRLRDPWVSNISGSDFRAGVVRRPG